MTVNRFAGMQEPFDAYKGLVQWTDGIFFVDLRDVLPTKLQDSTSQIKSS